MNFVTIGFAILGSIAAVTCESIFRLYPGHFGKIAMFTIPLAIITNYGVFNMMKFGSSMIEGIVLWTLVTTGLRIASTFFVIGEQPSIGSWAAFGLMIVASFVSKFWR